MNTTVVEKLISSVAPHNCLLCGVEGLPVCFDCQHGLLRPRRSACFMCNSLTVDFRTCESCRRKTPLKRVWVATRYEAYVKELIRIFKFERMRTAHVPLAILIDQSITAGEYDLIVPAPIATGRFRKRGYNQSELLARRLAKSRNLRLRNALLRRGQTRQVGHSRADRLKQLESSIYVADSSAKNQRVLLVDDVLTTGATLHQCAVQLKKAGAKSIEGAVIAGG